MEAFRAGGIAVLTTPASRNPRRAFSPLSASSEQPPTPGVAPHASEGGGLWRLLLKTLPKLGTGGLRDRRGGWHILRLVDQVGRLLLFHGWSGLWGGIDDQGRRAGSRSEKFCRFLFLNTILSKFLEHIILKNELEQWEDDGVHTCMTHRWKA